MSTLIIGGGPVGVALGFTLKKIGIPVLAVTSRNKKTALQVAKRLKIAPCHDYKVLVPKARLIFITTKDDAIHEVVQTIYQCNLLPEAFLAHCSGALTSKILKKRGSSVRVFSFHPLQTFVESSNQQIKDIYFAWEGDKETFALARELARQMKCQIVAIKSKDKHLYHVAACVASNFLVTLSWVASQLNERSGVSKQKSLSVLLPLIEGAVKNLISSGLPRALTGPIARGDTKIIEEHLKALKSKSPENLSLYKILSLKTIEVAISKGLSREKAEALFKLLEK